MYYIVDGKVYAVKNEKPLNVTFSAKETNTGIKYEIKEGNSEIDEIPAEAIPLTMREVIAKLHIIPNETKKKGASK